MNRTALLSMAAFAALVFVGLVVRKQSSSMQTMSSNKIVVGMMSGWAPFMSVSGLGEYVGFDVDVAKEIGRSLNKEIIIEDFGSLASCFIALDQGKVDMVMSGLDSTQKRQESMEMVRYTGEDVQNLSLLFWNKIPQNIKSLEDVAQCPNAIVCVESGSSQEKFLQSRDFITLKRVPSVVEGLLDVRFGKSLALLVEPRVGLYLQQKNPELKSINVELPNEFKIFGCGIAIKKGNKQLKSDVEKTVAALYKEGVLQEMQNLWGLAAVNGDANDIQ